MKGKVLRSMVPVLTQCCLSLLLRLFGPEFVNVGDEERGGACLFVTCWLTCKKGKTHRSVVPVVTQCSLSSA